MKFRKPCAEIHENGNSKKRAIWIYLTLFNGDSASGLKIEWCCTTRKTLASSFRRSILWIAPVGASRGRELEGPWGDRHFNLRILHNPRTSPPPHKRREEEDKGRKGYYTANMYSFTRHNHIVQYNYPEQETSMTYSKCVTYTGSWLRCMLAFLKLLKQSQSIPDQSVVRPLNASTIIG